MITYFMAFIFKKNHIWSYFFILYTGDHMKGIKLYIIIGIVFVSVLGTFLHFAYALSGNNLFVGLFTPINESIWEHTKLIYFPMLIYSIYLNIKLKDTYPCISSATILGALFGVLLIIVLFYTYSGILGHHISLIDISIFYISVIASFYITYKFAQSCKANHFNMLLQILNILMICAFIIFTLHAPKLPLFIAP